jgi:hypothetical protein
MESSNRPFEHVLVIMLENQYRSYVMENPFFKGLAAKGINMTNYFGAMHPSQTNYIASTAGELCNVTDDDQPSPLLTQNSIVDLFEASPVPLTWKAYMDSYSPDSQKSMTKKDHSTIVTIPAEPADAFPYVIKHNPFSSYANIVNNPERWAKVQGDSEFWQDIIKGTLPNYAWFTPNMWNDGHYIQDTVNISPPERAPVLVDQAAKWMERFFDTLKFPGPDSLLPKGTLVVVTWDEADFEAAYDKPTDKKYFYDGPNQIYTVLLGDMIEPGEQAEGYNHYSLLHTIEQNFSLGDLGKNDKDANWFQFLWDKEFAWGLPESTPIKASKHMAAAYFEDKTYVMTADVTGALSVQYFENDQWSPATAIGITTNGPIAMCADSQVLMLTYMGTDNAIYAVPYSAANGMGVQVKIGDGPCNSMALCAIDYGNALMFAWTLSDGTINSLTYSAGAWAATLVPVGFKSSGEIALECIGASVYLIYAAEGNLMHVVSYNTAEFNVVTISADTGYTTLYDDTSIDKWSPSYYPVAHFSHGFYPGTAKEQEPVTQPYEARGPFAIASLNGVMHLAHAPALGDNVVTETFSIPGIMTPTYEIKYDPNAPKTSDGYGTLAQAGWSTQVPLSDIQNTGTLAMTQSQEGVMLIYQPDENAELKMIRGKY